MFNLFLAFPSSVFGYLLFDSASISYITIKTLIERIKRNGKNSGSCVAKVNQSHWYLPSGEICEAFEESYFFRDLRSCGVENSWIREAHPCDFALVEQHEVLNGYSTGCFIRLVFFGAVLSAQPGKQDSRRQFSKGMYPLHSTNGGMWHWKAATLGPPPSRSQSDWDDLPPCASQSQMCRWKRPFCGLVPWSF